MLGLVQLSWVGFIILLFVLTEVTILSVTLYLHRSVAHRSLDLHPIISHFFRFWLWLTTGMVTKEWAAIHRKHHARVETQDDPHSPVTRGIKKVLLEGAELYREEAKNQETLAQFGQGTPSDWIEKHLYTPHHSLGIFSMLVVEVVLFGPIGLTLWALQMLSIPLFAAGVINGIGHYMGYRNYECIDNSRNIIPFGIFLGGEELHNNHHAFATSAKFSTKWWELDVGFMLIKLLSWLRLAKIKRVIPSVKKLAHKNVIDTDTLTAIISYRMQLMAQYSREVILPIMKQEKMKANAASKKLLVKTKKILIREVSLITLAQKNHLAKILENFKDLEMSYHFRMKLQDIWTRSTASQKELLEALQDWCHQAEATGIETLKSFSIRLKTYVPVVG